jgi:myosin heavy subunit
MSRDHRPSRSARSWPALMAGTALFLVAACGPSEEELRLQELTADLDVANATIDSLNYTIESSNLLLDEMRSRVDSLQQVDAKLLESVQRLNREVRQWRDLAREREEMNQQLTAEIERLKRDKQGDQRTIARLRSQADSVNTALLAAHTSIRRQEDHIKRMETELSQSRDEVAMLRQAETSVRIYAATEDFLQENGYLKTDRIFGRAFKKSYKLIKRLDPSDPRVQLVPIGEATALPGEVQAYVDRFGELKEGDSFRDQKNEAGTVQVTFTDQLLGGSDVLVVLKQ